MDDMMVDPLGNQAPRLTDRGFGVMDAIEGRAGTERLHVPVAVNHQLAIGGNHGTLATPSDGAYVSPHPEKPPHDQTRGARMGTTLVQHYLLAWARAIKAGGLGLAEGRPAPGRKLGSVAFHHAFLRDADKSLETLLLVIGAQQ
jgi:hypothetical protein